MEETKKEKFNRYDLTEGSVVKKMIVFALPLVLTYILQAVFGLCDMAIVGHYLGAPGMSAVNIAGLIINVLTAIAGGLSNGGNVFIGQLFGAKKRDDIPKIAGALLSFMVIVSIGLVALTIIFAKPMLVALDTPLEAFKDGVTYLMWVAAGSIFLFAYNALAASLRAVGDSFLPTIAITIGILVNIGLDYLFVGPLQMGVAGAAIATLVCEALTAVLAFIFAVKHKIITLNISDYKLRGDYVKTMLKIGLPLACQFALNVASYVLISAFVNQYGVDASAASGAVSKIGTFAILPSQALQATMLTLTAQNIAIKNYSRIKKSLAITLVISIFFSGAFWLAAHFAPQGMLSIFTTDRAVLEIGARFFQIMTISYIFESILFSFLGIISGSGYTILSFCLGLFSAYIVRFPLTIVFNKFTELGFNGIAWAYVCAPFAASLGAFIFYLTGKWKKSKIKL